MVPRRFLDGLETKRCDGRWTGKRGLRARAGPTDLENADSRAWEETSLPINSQNYDWRALLRSASRDVRRFCRQNRWCREKGVCLPDLLLDGGVAPEKYIAGGGRGGWERWVVRASSLAATRVRRCGAWQRHTTKGGRHGEEPEGAQ